MSLDLFVFYIAVELSISYQIANLFGYSAGTLLSYSLQRRFTFRIENKATLRLLIFSSIAGVGYLVSVALLWFFIELNNFDTTVSKLFTLPIVAMLQYFLNKNVTFGKIFQ